MKHTFEVRRWLSRLGSVRGMATGREVLERTQFYVNGAWVEPQKARSWEVINPATEDAVARISLGEREDVEMAIQAAKKAFSSWSRSSLGERVALLERMIEVYQRRAEEFAQAMTLEMGAPISYSRAVQTPCGDGHLITTLEALRSHAFERPSPRGGSLLRDEPVGVCGLITPWNWPINQIVIKVAPAIAAGCTMVLKPSELSPLSAMLFAEVLDEAGCPPGVFNLVNGDGEIAGTILSTHPDIDMVSFTGSTRAGIAISQAAAPTIKRVALELGGKSPNLLFADCDLEEATRFSVQFCFSNSGQSCDAPSRLLVERSVYDRVVELARAETEATLVGSPDKEGPHLGPVVSARHFQHIQDCIQKGIDEGARLVAGGVGRHPAMETGYFVRPTLFADVSNDMNIARTEVFGPVLCIIPFDSEEEAIRIANDTPYGLAAFVQTGDAARARRVTEQLRAGSVSINGAAADYDVPFGGYKQSGNGRENGAAGLVEFLETKSINGLF